MQPRSFATAAHGALQHGAEGSKLLGWDRCSAYCRCCCASDRALRRRCTVRDHSAARGRRKERCRWHVSTSLRGQRRGSQGGGNGKAAKSAAVKAAQHERRRVPPKNPQHYHITPCRYHCHSRSRQRRQARSGTAARSHQEGSRTWPHYAEVTIHLNLRGAGRPRRRRLSALGPSPAGPGRRTEVRPQARLRSTPPLRQPAFWDQSRDSSTCF